MNPDGSYSYPFSVTSSNPEVVSVSDPYSGEGIIEYAGTSNGYYVYTINFYAPRKTGSAKITIKATDGTNKSCSFTVKVY